MTRSAARNDPLSSRRNDLAFYLAAAERAPRLSREQEGELTRRWHATRDRAAADLLARAHLRHIVGQAMKYRHYRLPFGDLVAEGNMGLARALRRFEPDRGFRFVTYAKYWVRAQMLGYVVRWYGGVLGVGGALRSQVFFKLRRERVRVGNELGPGRAADQVLAERMGVSGERLQKLLARLDDREVPFDHPLGAEGRCPADYLQAADDQEGSLARHQFERGLREVVVRALEGLDDRERYIAHHRLMASSTEALSLAEIARHLKVSRERARQLETRAKRKLQRRIKESPSAVVREWLTAARARAPSAAASATNRESARRAAQGARQAVEVPAELLDGQ